MGITISQIEANIQNLINTFSKENFIYKFLLSFGLPKSSITRLQKGNLNLSKNKNEIIWKKKLFFRELHEVDLHLSITQMLEDSKHNERFIMVTDFQTLLAIDAKTKEKLDIELKELSKHYDFFLPLAGMEKANHQDENPADVKAAAKMAKLFDEIRKDNPSDSPVFLHNLNVFLTRLLFCFFAEDTNIFEKSQFTNAIDSHTQEDGSDLNEYFDRLFEVLNTPKSKRKSIPAYLNAFPYVNGGLFRDKIISPKFTKSSRSAILISGDQDWSEINPDIFGSMFQAVVSEDQRSNLGQHYTSVPNIMKVIKPLFLDELNEDFEKNKNKPQKLIYLLNRLGKIKIFDPACGSGNFLIIAYKELRILEIKIIRQLLVLQKRVSSFDPTEEQLSIIPKSQLSLAASFQVDLFSRIQLNQFYGIELDDFAHEVAKLSLWLAEHQMNILFLNEFGKTNPTLPLQEAGKIVCANACRIDWEDVCPKEKGDEIYILGNPPYLGSRNQSFDQKVDLTVNLKSIKNYKKLDYISCWFKKASLFNDSKSAFVTTNSICQGEQVSILWPHILKNKEIHFCLLPFKWQNNAKKNAGVTVAIIGLANNITEKKIIAHNYVKTVKNINPYLIDNHNFYITKRNDNLSSLPKMNYGNYTGGCNELLLSQSEYNEIISNNDGIQSFIRPFKGANELLNNIERYCIWIKSDDYKKALAYSIFQKKFTLVKNERSKSKDPNINELANRPHQFRDLNEAKKQSIVVPIVTSERRDYLPSGILPAKFIIPNSAHVIYDSVVYIFSLLSSKIHFLWIKTVCGSLESRIRYSSQLGYNTFPFPNISDQRKQELTQTTFRILEEREKHPDKTLAELYAPDKLPDGLREAHHQNDLAVERCYRSKPFESDEERLEYLFKLYEQMIEEEKERYTLFAKEKKSSKKKKK